jgi:hypothetical protein
VSSLVRIAAAHRGASREPPRHDHWATSLVWVGLDAHEGLRCHAQPLVSRDELYAESTCPGCEPEKHVEVQIQPEKLVTVWRVGNTVVNVVDVPLDQPDGESRFPAFRRRLADDWRANGNHIAAFDRRQDLAIVRIPESISFRDATGVLDAVEAVDRPFGGQGDRGPVFEAWLVPEHD